MMKRNRGFTLLELMIVVAILGILMVIAVPSFNRLLAASKTNELAELWTASYFTAQREALLRREPVMLCASSNAEDCSQNNAQDYSNGWVVRTANTVLQVVNAPNPDHVKAILNGLSLTAPNSSKVGLYFLRDGRLPANVVGGRKFTITYYKKLDDSKTGIASKTLNISDTGGLSQN